MITTLNSKTETEAWAKEFARSLKRPAVVEFVGDLGAGKTQMVRWMVEALGGSWASSPTFAIHQTYETPSGVIDHLDLYRLKDVQDLESTGFWDLLERDDALIFIEWADRLQDFRWPETWRKARIELTRLEGEKRAIKFSG